MKCTINEFPCFLHCSASFVTDLTLCEKKGMKYFLPASNVCDIKASAAWVLNCKHKLCLKMMANWRAADRILWRLIVAWSHPGFGGSNPDPSGSCIIIHKERLKKQPQEQLNNPHQKTKENNSSSTSSHAAPPSFTTPPPGHGFPHCVVPSRGQTLQMYRQPGLRSQFQELSLLFLCSWLLSPIHPWVSSNIWPCFGPDRAYNQAQRTTKFSWRKNTESIVRPCLYGRGSVCRCTHTHAEATLANPIPLKALCGFSTW